MSQVSNKSKFRVVIVGGGIAGLTLANTLQNAGIDFVLLESRSVIDPQVGASIGMLPNGSRILDQVGCYDDLLALVDPIQRGMNHNRDGSLIGEPTDMPVLGAIRTAYATAFLDRKLVLGVLAKHVTDKTKILLNKRVIRIEHSPEKASVVCEDGSREDGDIIIGADGVYSIVRREMWRCGEIAGEGARFERDKKIMKAEYKCLFGISNPIEGMPVGDFDVSFAKGMSTLSIVGKGGRIFWFFFVKMDQVYYVPNIPCFTEDDARKLVDEAGHIAIKEDSKVTVRDLYNARLTSTLVALEEADFEQWSWGRMVCIGDAVHKMTPNLGAGGNSAIESAAALSNILNRLSKEIDPKKLSINTIRESLEEYQEKRRTRIRETMKMANGLTRLHALSSSVDYFVAHFVLPNAGDFIGDLYAESQIGAELLDYLPPPRRSLEATMPFNPVQGWGYAESKVKRAFWALPFLGMSFLCVQMMGFDRVVPHIRAIAQTGSFTHGSVSVSLFENFHHVKFLDDFWKPAIAAFLPSVLDLDPGSGWQSFSLIIDASTIYAIWLVESNRRNNKLSAAQIPIVFGLLFQRNTIGVIAPIYFFFLYVSTPIANFKAADHRLTDLAYTYTILPSMCLFSIIPAYLMYHSADPSARQYWAWAWQMFPVWVAGAQLLLADTLVPRTVQHDRVYKPARDKLAIRITVSFFGLLSAATWLYTLTSSPFSLAAMFVPRPGASLPDAYFPLVRNLLQWDQAFAGGSAMLWLAYAFGDLKAAGMVTQSWLLLVALGSAAIACFGPGAAFAAGWLWREEVLLTRRHWAAVIKKTG